MKGFFHFLGSIALVFAAAYVFDRWGGAIVMGLVIGLPLLDYLSRSGRDQ